MSEPEPQSGTDQSTEVECNTALDIPCVNVLGLPDTESPMTIRDLTQRLATNPDARETWTVYMHPTKPKDALRVEELVDLDAVDEIEEMDEDDKEELATQVLASLEEAAFKAVNEQVGSARKKRKHPITAISWCTLSKEESRWTTELKAAVEAISEPEVRALASTLSDFEYAQYSIVSKGVTEKGVERIANMAKLKAKYKLDSNQDAVVVSFALAVHVHGVAERTVITMRVHCMHRARWSNEQPGSRSGCHPAHGCHAPVTHWADRLPRWTTPNIPRSTSLRCAKFHAVTRCCAFGQSFVRCNPVPQEDYAKLCAVTIDMMDALSADLDEIRGGACEIERRFLIAGRGSRCWSWKTHCTTTMSTFR